MTQHVICCRVSTQNSQPSLHIHAPAQIIGSQLDNDLSTSTVISTSGVRHTVILDSPLF